MTFDLSMNGDISIDFDQIVMYHISNIITRCQLNGKKTYVNILICTEIDICNGLLKENMVNIYTVVYFS